MVTAAADQIADEGTAQTFDLGSFSDAGDDTPWTVIVDWGDLSSDTFTDSEASAGAITDRSHTYADNGTYNVTVTVREAGGVSAPSGSASFDVTVANLAPVLTAAADQGSDEGQDVAFDLGSFSDAGANDADWTVDIDWGDSSSDTFDAALQGGLGALNHTYADDGLYSVEVCVTDKDLASDCATFEITVDNVAPTIALSGDASVDEGSLYSLTLGAVTDPGDDTVIEWIVDWGDGGSVSYFADGVVTHTYADGPADYTISVDLLDEDGTHLAAGSHDVHVDNVKPSISLSGPTPPTRATPRPTPSWSSIRASMTRRPSPSTAVPMAPRSA